MFGHDSRSLGQLFATPVEGKSSSYFRVPKYQRKYEWQKENQVQKLIEDVFDNIGRSYFMGPLIVCSRSLLSTSTEEDFVELTDGQQRLATFALFLRVLVDYIQKRKKQAGFPAELVDKINEIQYELRSKIIKGGLSYKIPVMYLSKRINQFFRDEIIMTDNEDRIERLAQLKKGQHPSIVSLIDAYSKIWQTMTERYDSITGEDLVLQLHKLATSLLDEKMFLVITVDNDSDAYTIFETINWRGKPLTLNDLVKNLCFKRLEDTLSEDDLNEFEDDWDESELLTSNFALFMWHAWVSRYDTCPKNAVFGELQKLTKDMSSDHVFDFATDLIFADTRYYHIYENPDKEPHEDKRRYLGMLSAMDATRCYPLLLSIDYAQQKKEIITINEAVELFKLITRLTFWYSGICSRDAKSLESIYHRLAKKIRAATKQTKEAAIKEIVKELGDKFPPEDECKASFTTRAFTDKGFVKMVLEEIEKNEYQKGELTLKGPKDVQLEHILPKNPDRSWKQIFEDNKVMEYTYKFGNYTLLYGSLNRSARNGPFSAKKKFYDKSQIGLTKALTEVEEWNADSINMRTVCLYELAKKTWPLP
jgi:hypothetical protein